MRFSLVRSSLLSLLIASSASAVAIDWVTIGDPGNPGDPQSSCYQCGPGTSFGSVGYTYQISKYEITNAQYVEFLNAKAASDPNQLYSVNMANPGSPDVGGITRSGGPGSYTYSVIAGRGDMPVNNVSFYDALRFANWLNNGQGAGDTETGAYTLVGGTHNPSNGDTVTRNAGALIFLTSEDEWYKAAYYDAASTSYFDFTAGSNAQIGCVAPSATPNTANCDGFTDDASDADVDNLTIVGSFTGSASPYGTFDQGGNLEEWNESLIGSSTRGLRGGGFSLGSYAVDASFRTFSTAFAGYSYSGFRIVMVPEPGTGLLVIAGLLGLAGWRRAGA